MGKYFYITTKNTDKGQKGKYNYRNKGNENKHKRNKTKCESFIRGRIKKQRPGEPERCN